MMSIVAALAVQVVVFPDRPAGPIESTAEAVAKLVGALGSDEPMAREEATARLFWAGEPAREALKKAAGSEDLEVSSRAKAVLQLLDARAALKPFEPTERINGAFQAGSIEDPEALGGYAKSENRPKAMKPEMAAGKTEVFLLVEPDALTVARKSFVGMRLSLVNPTSKAVWFPACDSLLNLVQQAKDAKGEWRDVEDAPDSG